MGGNAGERGKERGGGVRSWNIMNRAWRIMLIF